MLDRESLIANQKQPWGGYTIEDHPLALPWHENSAGKHHVIIPLAPKTAQLDIELHDLYQLHSYGLFVLIDLVVVVLKVQNSELSFFYINHGHDNSAQDGAQRAHIDHSNATTQGENKKTETKNVSKRITDRRLECAQCSSQAFPLQEPEWLYDLQVRFTLQ